jgi:acetyl-CoA C-acetyltransferase
VVGLIDELRRRYPSLDPALVDDIVLGVVSAVGDQGAVIARTAAIVAGLPYTVAGVTLNRFCASGLEAVNIAAQKVRAGWDDLVLAGGVESMSRVPWAPTAGPGRWTRRRTSRPASSRRGYRPILIATIEGLGRDDVDAFAARSHQRAAKAWADGAFDRAVVPVKDRVGQVILDRDETIRPEASPESMAGLEPSFAAIGDMGGFDAVALQRYHWVEQINHVHHAGNSSGIVDGASLVAIGTEAAGAAAGFTPRARVVSAVVTGAEPTIMLTGPEVAARKALAKAGLKVDDISLFEVNEAFRGRTDALHARAGRRPEIVNVNGGAIAMGHPLGATGAMLVGTLLDELERRNQRYGLATLCVGGGMGIATIIERL